MMDFYEDELYYDNFLCFSKKCKNRVAENRKIRQERRGLKNDERRANTEGIRAETSMMSGTAAPSSRFSTGGGGSNSIAEQQSTVQQAGIGSSKIIMVVIGLVVLGALYQNMKKQKGAVAPFKN